VPLAISSQYDPDGNATSSGSGATTDLRFAGGQVVGSLYHYGARYYDPAVGRWTQQDPINSYVDLTQANRYAYAGGDPINSVDPDGTSTRLGRFIYCVALNLKRLGVDEDCEEDCVDCAEEILEGGSLISFPCYSCALCLWDTGLDLGDLRELVSFCWRWSKHGHIGSRSCIIGG
jgi:RHS repeat-associated protein